MDRIIFNHEYLDRLKSCGKLFEELSDYGISYKINFKEIMENVDSNSRLSELPTNLHNHSLEMIELLAPYRFPHLRWLLLAFTASCYINYKSPKKWGIKNCVQISTGLLGFYTIVYTIRRFSLDLY